MAKQKIDWEQAGGMAFTAGLTGWLMILAFIQIFEGTLVHNPSKTGIAIIAIGIGMLGAMTGLATWYFIKLLRDGSPLPQPMPPEVRESIDITGT